MTRKFDTAAFWMAGALALCLAGINVSSAAGVDAPVIKVAAVAGDADVAIPAPSLPIPDELAEFADAPYGVDPIVTGPVSAAFKQRREGANCDAAIWPNVPAVCFPD
jgi:hypothetical protein